MGARWSTVEVALAVEVEVEVEERPNANPLRRPRLSVTGDLVTRTPHPWKTLLTGAGAGAVLGLGYSFISQALGST